MPTEHEPTDECEVWHCHWHHVDEAADGYKICPECLHTWTSKRELRREYRRQVLRIPALGVPWWRILWSAWTIRAEKIYFCQHCIHDF